MFPYRDENPAILTPFVTVGLIAANLAVWVVFQGMGNEQRLAATVCEYGLTPGDLLHRLPIGSAFPVGDGMACVIDGSSAWFTVLTSMFLHGGWLHVLGNMWFLWIFGNNVEDAMGHARFFVFYLVCGFAAAAAQVLSGPDSAVSMVGASGAISGVMGAYVVLYPRVRVHCIVWLILIFRFAVPAWLMLRLLVSSPACRRGDGPGWRCCGLRAYRRLPCRRPADHTLPRPRASGATLALAGVAWLGRVSIRAPVVRNAGMPLDLSWIRRTRVRSEAIEAYATQVAADPPMLPGRRLDWLLRAITLIDLTTLQGDDTDARVRTLCATACRPLPPAVRRALHIPTTTIHTASVCVYHAFVRTAKTALAGSGIPVAAVSAGFPAGLSPLPTRIAEIRASVRAGAREIDAVIMRAHVLTGDWEKLYDEIRAFRTAAGRAHLKVILATGELGTLTNVARASLVAMMAGADFVKTSTGKEQVNATIPAGIVMARSIHAYQGAHRICRRTQARRRHRHGRSRPQMARHGAGRAWRAMAAAGPVPVRGLVAAGRYCGEAGTRRKASGCVNRPIRILFLCTGNSARSQIAEALTNVKGAGRVVAESAGSAPAAAVHPLAIAVLAEAGLPWSGHPPRGLDGLEAQRWDAVITVCDNARDACPVFYGAGATAHWGMTDPAHALGPAAQRRQAFRDARALLERRIDALLAMPLEDLTPSGIEAGLRAIGATRSSAPLATVATAIRPGRQ